MKPLIFFLLIAASAKSQDKFYFLEMRATGKFEVAVTPERGVTYPDIDSLVSVTVKGKVKEKLYPSWSAAFNCLSAAGLEFVGFAFLPTLGGATQMLGGNQATHYLIWRRKLTPNE